MKLRVVPANQIEAVLDMGELIREMEDGFRAYYSGEVGMPERAILDIPGRGFFLFMPAVYKDVVSLKTISVFPRNMELGKNTSYSVIVVQSAETGEPIAVLNGETITAYRTGAVTGVAAKYLAPKNARTIGVIGAGRQARTQLLALKEVTGGRDVLIYDVSREAATSFAAFSAKLGFASSILESPKDVVERADIVVLATTSRTPVIEGEWIRPGMLIVSIGWVGVESREVDTQTLRKSDKIVVDSLEAAKREAGDIRVPLELGEISEKEIHAELGEIVAGVKPGREEDRETIFFKSVGLAFEDAVASRLVLAKLGEGRTLVEI